MVVGRVVCGACEVTLPGGLAGDITGRGDICVWGDICGGRGDICGES